MRIEDFPLSWRWTQESHVVLPPNVLETVRPIDAAQAHALYQRASRAFQGASAREERRCGSTDKGKARDWLRELPVPVEAIVTVVWNDELGVSLPWNVFIAYWDDFCYPGSDDAFIFLPGRLGVIAYEHYEEFCHRAGVA